MTGPESNPVTLKRSISTDPESLAPSSPEKSTNLPTSHLESLFSPSVFQSPAPVPKHFTFDTHHMNRRIAHPISRFQDEPPTYPEGSISTPRFDDKELYAVLCDVANLESPKHAQPEPYDLSDWLTPHAPLSSNRSRNFNLSSHSPKTSTPWLANETVQPPQAPQDNRYPSTHISSPEAVDPTLSPLSRVYPLPSIPKLPVVAPSLSIVDLENVLKSDRQSHIFYHTAMNSAPDYLNQEIPRLPPLPTIPFASISVPFLPPFDGVDSEDTDQLEIDSEDHPSKSGCVSSSGNKGMYSLCQLVLDYIKTSERNSLTR